MSGRVDGRVALVTGGSEGIGLAAARRLAAEGAKVYLTGRRPELVAEAATLVGHGAVGIAGDIASSAHRSDLADVIGRAEGRLDILFANVGVGEYAPFGEITEEQFDRLFNINVKGVLFTAQAFLPLMRSGSSIILNGSISGSKAEPGMTVYAATKAALRAFARSWAADLAGREIRVNLVSPGIIPTPAHIRHGATDELYESLAREIPMRRVGQADEIAGAVLFFASSDSSYVTGTELFVDGGFIQA